MHFHEKPMTYVGEVGLKVLNLESMVEFYRDVIGLRVIEKSADSAVLGAGAKKLLKLDKVEGLQVKDQRYAGLYHFAILLPSREDLGRMLIHLHDKGVHLGSADHLVSEALYLSDPEGNGIEIYRDREPEDWSWSGSEVVMAVDPIDATGLVHAAQSTEASWQGMPESTVIGHIHLHVSDLAKAKDFYANGLEFEVTASMGDQAHFLGDGNYHHHIAVNVWNGTNIPALPKKRAGLDYFTLILADEEKRQRIVERLRALGAEIDEREEYSETVDPSGNVIRLVI